MKLLLVAAVIPLAEAFVGRPSTFLRRSALLATEADADAEVVKPGSGLVTDLMATVSDGAIDVSPSKRVMVNEMLLKLESENPTAAPATSPLLNGVWELAYTGGYSEGPLQSPTRQLALFLYAGGYAPATFALTLSRLLPESVLEVSNTKLTISRSQPRAIGEGEVKIAGVSAPTKVAITSTLETESDVRLKETYTTLKFGENNVDIPEALQYSRLLFVTYLDEDLMVARDETGVPEILVRKSMEFQSSEGTSEPSSADDDLAPGAG